MAKFSMLMILVSLMAVPTFAGVDHCEKAETTEAVLERLETPAATNVPVTTDDHEGECPMQHQGCLHFVSILREDPTPVLGWPQFVSRPFERPTFFKNEPVLDGPFQPPRV